MLRRLEGPPALEKSGPAADLFESAAVRPVNYF
jgi:hypothetical protein